jgi:hypothetical protein
MTELKDFLASLAIDSRKLGEFIHDPESAMAAAELSEDDKAALKSGFPALIHARLAGLSVQDAFKITLRPPVTPQQFVFPVQIQQPSQFAYRQPPQVGQYELPVQFMYQLPPQFIYQLPPQFIHQLPPQFIYQLPPQFIHQLPPQFIHQLPPQFIHQLPPQFIYQLPPQFIHQLPPQMPPLWWR